MNEFFRKGIGFFKVVGAIKETVGPVEAQPVNIFLNGLHIFCVFLRGIGIVHAQIAHAAILFRCAKINDEGFAVPDVQIAVGFRRETGVHRHTGELTAFGNVLVNKSVDKILVFRDFSHT